MYGFHQKKGNRITSNRGGLRTLFFTECANLVAEPRPRRELDREALIVEEIPLVAGAAWYQLTATKFTMRFTESERVSRQGTLYNKSLVGVIGKYRPEVIEFFNQFRGKKLAVIYHDVNGMLVAVSSKNYGLEVTRKVDSGRSPSDFNSVDFEMTGTSKQQALFYHGNLYDYLATEVVPDFGDISVQIRVIEDGQTIRILEA